MCLQFGFVIFWRKEIGAKTAHKMLVKLTLGAKFHQQPISLKNLEAAFSLKLFTKEIQK